MTCTFEIGLYSEIANLDIHAVASLANQDVDVCQILAGRQLSNHLPHLKRHTPLKRNIIIIPYVDCT